MSKKKTVYVFTQAYNAEKTLERTIQSVLSQTYTDIVYYLVDSASTDETQKIITQYANQDNRVRSIWLDKNEQWEMYNFLPYIVEIDKEGYFTQIDADDEYVPCFIEKVMSFMCIHHLDIAACTSAYIAGNTDKDVSKVILQEDLIIEGNKFQDDFKEYFKYFRDSWGKIFSLKVFEHINYDKFDKKIMTSSVSYLAFEALLNARRIGVYHEQLHRYYIYSDSFERTLQNHKRMLTPTLYMFYYTYLIRKCGVISEENKNFLIDSYCNSVWNKIKNLKLNMLNADDRKRMELLIVDNEFMSVIMESNNLENIGKIQRVISLLQSGREGSNK